MPRINFKSILTSSTSVAAFCAMSVISTPTALAQEGTEDVSRQDTIIVTATRRNESIQDIPINISAVGGDQIEQQGFGDISELAAFVPGLNIADQGGRDGNRIVVRGLNAEPLQNSFGQADGGGTVATYIGDIPLFVDLRLNDLERVEVLLGPQGTLYGAGTMGGAIRYIPTKPQLGTEVFELRSDLYAYSDTESISSDLGATVNFPISENFAIRASVDGLNDRGFIDYPYVVQQPGVSNPDPDFTNAADVAANLNPLTNVNTEKSVSGRVAARWQPSDWLDGTLTYYFQNQDNGGRNTSGKRGTLQTGDYETAQRVVEPNERETSLLALEVTADLGFAELTSATGFARSEENGQRDQTDLLITLEYSYETFPTFTAFTFEDERTDIFNQELRLVSKGDHRYNWIVGTFYNENSYTSLSEEYTPGYFAFLGATEPASGALEYFSAGRGDLEEFAVFGELGYDITDNWDITVGARFYDYTFQTGNVTFFPIVEAVFDGLPANELSQPFALDAVDGNVALDPTALQEDNGTLFKINSSYKFGGGNTVYATFSQGYRLGGKNAGGDCPAFDPNASQGVCLLAAGQQFGADAVNDVRQLDERSYKSDSVNNYELGLKTTWLDGDLTLNGSLFFMQWTDPQISATSVNAGTSIFVNAGAAETKGVDLAGEWQITDGFNLRGTFSFVDADLTEAVPDLITTISTAGFGTLFEAGQSGDRLPGSPKTQFSLYGSYAWGFANGNDLILDGGYAYQGDVLDEAGARGNSLTLDPYGRANTALTYQTDRWSVTGYVDNVFDEYSETSVAANSLFNQTILGANVRSFRTNVLPPRSIGLRVKYVLN